MTDRKAINVACGLFLFTCGLWVFAVCSFGGKQKDPKEISQTLFGWNGMDINQYPECQTDLEMSDAWSIRLMYLNGAWTAGCIHEVDRRRALIAEQEGSE